MPSETFFREEEQGSDALGRSFGLGTTGAPENYMFSAVGHWMESDGVVESEPSKYRV